MGIWVTNKMGSLSMGIWITNKMGSLSTQMCAGYGRLGRKNAAGVRQGCNRGGGTGGVRQGGYGKGGCNRMGAA